jgi:beta-glucosidase
MKFYTKAAHSSAETKREQDNRQLAYEAACEGIVLLENNNNVLPIAPGKIALYGAGGIYTIKGGTGSGEVNERRSYTIAEGLEGVGYKITNQAWLSDYKTEYERKLARFKQEIAKKTRTLSINNLMNALGEQFMPPFGREITVADFIESDTETAVYVVSRQAGEGLDRRLDKGENNLDPVEIAHIQSLIKLYKKTILIINTGASLDTSFMDQLEGLGALVYFCQQGMEGGRALAAVISGQTPISGRLTSTWAYKYDDYPCAREFSYLNGDLANEYYREGIYVGYRYFDSFEVKPRYEFGFGLGYSETEIKLTDITRSNYDKKNKIDAQVLIRNIGTSNTREVPQIYVSCPSGKILREYQQLAAYTKTSILKPGEEQIVTLSFNFTDLAAYDEETASYILEAGEYIVRLGHSSRRNVPVAVIHLNDDAVISQHEHICPLKTEFEELKPVLTDNAKQLNTNRPLIVDYQKLPRLELDSSELKHTKHSYDKPRIYHDEQVDAIMKKLTHDEMVDVVVGAGMFMNKNKIDIPGSVGNTTSKFYNKGLINVALCDGPAGLRLARESGLKKDGSTKPYSMPLSFLESFPKIFKKLMTADPRKTQPVYQYATAFPVATALAQSWNDVLLEQVGQAICAEMVEYGVTYWLAPALNIQRNPLCGRNFEYYSEDPLLSGKYAAAVTRGIQSVDGVYATIKHYLCNNQEDNRNKVSSNVRERALREIYLRGFRIAVEEGRAKSVMTSYNKINGVYAPNSYDACTRVLRNEWGFDGVVMTDWMSTSKDRASAAQCIAAGNDLIMAGMGFDRKDIRQALKKGTLAQEDLERCCANVIRSIVHSRIAQEVSAEILS